MLKSFYQNLSVGMTKEAYWFTFLKKNYSKEDLLYLETLVKHPDYAAMRQGKRDD